MPIPIIPRSVSADSVPGTEQTPSAGLHLYLISIKSAFPDQGYFKKMIRLTAPVTFNSVRYWLVAATATLEQDHALRIVNPQPSGWAGSLPEAKRLLRQNDLIHFWFAIDSFVAAANQPIEVRSNFMAWLPWCDASAWPTQYGYHPNLWSGSYEQWIEFIGLDETFELCPRCILNRPFGADEAGYIVGQYPNGTPLGCEPLAPRYLELQPGLPSHIMSGFTTALGPRVQRKVLEGGEVCGYIGAPSLTFDGTGVDWVREFHEIGMSSGWDVCGAIDRISAQQCVRCSDELVAIGHRIYMEPHDFSIYATQLGGWYDGRFRSLSTYARAELVYASPANYLTPSPPTENVALVIGGIYNDPVVRFNACKEWIDRGWTATAPVRINTGNDLGEADNMSVDQVLELVEYGT